MSWQNETRETIKFKSPEGNTFEALWKANDRSFEKKLGLFDLPGIKGTFVQDLNVKSMSYPLTVYFEGMNHYQTANDFSDALQNEIGQWEIVHPTKGALILQLVSATEKIDPTGDGNFTQFETQWLEPANIERIISVDELSSQVLTQILNTLEDSKTQLAQLRSDLYAAVQSALNVVNQVTGITEITVSELAATSNLVSESWESAKNSLSNTSELWKADPSDITAQSNMVDDLFDVVSLPIDASTDYATRFSAYREMLDSAILLSPTSNIEEDFNRALFQELGLIIILQSICKIITTSVFSTRVEVISAMDALTLAFTDAVNAIESVQELFETTTIEKQYFSQSKSWSALQYLFALTMRYLISQFFNLKSEKRFTLKNARSPLEITVTEYGDLGENESNYQLFLDSNNLTGKDILILPAGREVVVYAG